MRSLPLVLVLTLAPVAAWASPSLLGGRTLVLSLLSDDLPVPPPPPPSEPPPRLSPDNSNAPPNTPTGLPVAGEEPPGLGGVLGYMITGGGLLLEGALLLLTGAVIVAAGGSAVAAGVFYLVLGGAHVIVGGVLLYIGNNKRVDREAWNQQHGIARLEPDHALPVLALSF